MNNRGFTLIELMVTVVVLVILAGLAVPSFVDYMQKARVRGVADQVTNLLARARVAAVKTNTPIGVRAQAAGGDWCIGATQPAAPAEWALRPSSATACQCLTDVASCRVEGEPLVVTASTFGESQRPSVVITDTATDFNFSYTPKLGGISANGAPGKAFLSPTSDSLVITSPNGRYTANVVVTPLGQSYVCVPAGQPPFFGYRTC